MGGDDGGSSDFDDRVYPRSYPVPGRLNLKRALRAYVHGHDRGWDAARKAELGEREDREAQAGYLGAGQALARGRETARPGAGSSDPEGDAAGGRAGDVREGARYGVPIPEKLDFHRSADTWRDRIPRPHQARRPAGWSDGRADDDDEPRRGE